MYYQDIEDARKEFLKAQNNFLRLNYTFYHTLTVQINHSMEIPPAKFIALKSKTGQIDNIIEECVYLEDNYCQMKIGYIFGHIMHKVLLKTQMRDANNLTLIVKTDFSEGSFDFFISGTDVKNLKFDEVIHFICSSFVNGYAKMTDFYKVGN